MPISTTCPNCKAIFRLPEELAGKKVKCQKCEGLFVVPAVIADTLAPGARVSSPDAPKKTVLESAGAKTKADLTPPEEIPVTAHFANDDDEPDRDDEDEPRSQPRRGERGPRRDEKPKSAFLPIVLTLCGLALFSCVGIGAVLAIWFLAAADQQKVVIQKQPVVGPGMNFKKGPAKLNPEGGRLPNLTKTIELKLDEKGFVRVDTALTLQDELNPDQKRHKHYAIELEEGKRYQIDMKVPKTVIIQNTQTKQFDAYLYLIDDMNKIVGENDDVEPPVGMKPGNQDSQIIFTAPRTATYKIEATFFDNGWGLELGDFTLTVKRLPD